MIREENPESLRYERKFVVSGPGANQQAIALVLRLHPALFSEVYYERWVNSLYFDTPDHRLYAESEAGMGDRTKVRLRWYGPLQDPVSQPWLELKVKTNTLGRKARHALADACFDELLEPDRTRAWLARSADAEEATAIIRLFAPTLLNHYRRRYYLSACGRFRITVDTDIEFYRVRSGWTSLLSRSVVPGVAIVEVKYAAEHDMAARSVTAGLPYRQDRNSKYLVGRQMLAL